MSSSQCQTPSRPKSSQSAESRVALVGSPQAKGKQAKLKRRHRPPPLIKTSKRKLPREVSSIVWSSFQEHCTSFSAVLLANFYYIGFLTTILILISCTGRVVSICPSTVCMSHNLLVFTLSLVATVHVVTSILFLVCRTEYHL